MTETTEPKRRKGGPRDIPAHVGLKEQDAADDVKIADLIADTKIAADVARGMVMSHVAIASIIVSPTRRVPDPAKVQQFASSMRDIGLRTPITVRESKTVADKYDLITGAHRLAAARLLGWFAIEAFIVIAPNDLDDELWEIDENLVRAELDAAEHALHTKRRAEIIEAREKAEAENLSQSGTGLEKKGKGGRGKKDKAAASIRDQAEKTGESKSKIARSKQRADKLGVETLQKVVGTSLDSGVELDALAQLPPEQRDELIEEAKAGKEVSARDAAQCAKDGEEVRIPVYAHEQYAEQIKTIARVIAQTCAAAGGKAILPPPDLPRERAHELLELIDEVRVELDALRRDLREIIVDEPEDATVIAEEAGQ
jgi:ParB/RepB/Spo0J family partition protein